MSGSYLDVPTVERAVRDLAAEDIDLAEAVRYLRTQGIHTDTDALEQAAAIADTLRDLDDYNRGYGLPDTARWKDQDGRPLADHELDTIAAQARTDLNAAVNRIAGIPSITRDRGTHTEADAARFEQRRGDGA